MFVEYRWELPETISVLAKKVHRFLEELRRRKVYRVAAGYAAFAFIVVQVADLVIPAFDFSGRAYRMVVILALLGFPVAMILAWVFDWTPEGVQVTRAADSADQSSVSSRKITIELLIAIVVIGAAVSTSWYLARSEESAPRTVDRSIAVLPFEKMDAAGHVSFTDGVHNDLLTRLSEIQGLSVIARRSVERYRGSDKSSSEIATELGVRWVLEGTVQHIGDEVRVNARLVDPKPDVQAWADSYLYDLSAKNLFAIQSEIARKIAAALQMQLTPEEQLSVNAKPTENLQAYQLFVEARTLLEQREEPQMRRALTLFEQARDLDDGFALAWVGIADALYELVDYEFQMPAGSIDRALQAAERASQLDPDNAEAFVSLGIIYHLRQDGLEALRHLDKAIELRPGYAEAFSKVSWVAQILGRAELAAESAEKALALDPLALEPRANFALTRLFQNDAQLALDTLRSDNELIPPWSTLQFYEGIVLYHMGHYADAREALAELSIPWAGAGPLAAEALACIGLNDTATASAILSQLKVSNAHPFLIGLVHAGLGDQEAAFAEFDNIDGWTIDADWPVLAARYLFPDILGDLRSDPRYDRLLRNIDRAWGLVM